MNDDASKVTAAQLNDILVGCLIMHDSGRLLGTITGIVHAHGTVIVRLDTGWCQLAPHQVVNLNLEFVG